MPRTPSAEAQRRHQNGGDGPGQAAQGTVGRVADRHSGGLGALGPAGNRVQNGRLLTSGFHTLFDDGPAVEPPTGPPSEHWVLVAKTIRERWNEGRRCNQYDRQAVKPPIDASARPSRDALERHLAHKFDRVA